MFPEVLIIVLFLTGIWLDIRLGITNGRWIRAKMRRVGQLVFWRRIGDPPFPPRKRHSRSPRQARDQVDPQLLQQLLLAHRHAGEIARGLPIAEDRNPEPMALKTCPTFETRTRGTEVNRPLTYLACPYSHPDRAVRLARFEAANRAAAALMARGSVVFSPLSHTHPIAEAADLPLGWDFWREFDTCYLSCSQELVVLTMPGWRESVGVQAEIAIAKEMGIPVTLMHHA